MAELEKVIRGLECLSNPYAQDMDERDCENCQYDNASCFLDVTADALTLLKAREPRVMTLEEIKKAEVVWLECYGICSNMFKAALPRHPLSINDATWDFETYPYTEVMFLAEYGRNWRCWTARPTDEQREATPWRD